MKRLPPVLLLLLSLLLVGPALPAAAQGGTGRTVLVEFFCTQGCQWAATAAQALDRVADGYGPDRVLAVEYNLDLSPEDFERRFYTYVPPGTHVPFAFFDGSRRSVYGSNNDAEESYGWYRDAVEAELAAPSPVRLEAARRFDGRQVTFEARLTNVSGTPVDSADLYFALYERAQIGRTHRLLRHLSPALPVGPLAPQESVTLTYTSAPLPVDSDLTLVEGLAFLQSPDSLEVHQAAHATAPSASLGLPSIAAVTTPDGVVGPFTVVVDGLGLPFTWSVERPGEAWLQVTPEAGARGEPFHLTLDPAGLPYGTHTASIAVHTDADIHPAEHALPVVLHVVPEVHTVCLPMVQ